MHLVAKEKVNEPGKHSATEKEPRVGRGNASQHGCEVAPVAFSDLIYDTKDEGDTTGLACIAKELILLSLSYVKSDS